MKDQVIRHSILWGRAGSAACYGFISINDPLSRTLDLFRQQVNTPRERLCQLVPSITDHPPEQNTSSRVRLLEIWYYFKVQWLYVVLIGIISGIELSRFQIPAKDLNFCLQILLIRAIDEVIHCHRGLKQLEEHGVGSLLSSARTSMHPQTRKCYKTKHWSTNFKICHQ